MIDCKSRPVIFPKLARRMIVSEGRLVLVGRKRADFKLLELLISTEDLPHVMVWNTRTKEWEAHQNHSTIQLMDDVFVEYDYEELVHYDNALILSWLNLYSSASFKLLDCRDEGELAV